MAASAEVTLARGYWRDGLCHRGASLRGPTGADELSLLEESGGSLPAERTTALLARCLTRLGPETDVRAEQARALTLGDRQALMLELHRLTFGERLDCVLACPNADCGEPLELELAVSDLLVPPESDPPFVHETTVGETTVRFRLPTGRDQEEAGRRAVADGVDAAAAGLIRSCLEASAESSPEEVSPEVLDAVAERMRTLDSQSEIELSITCPDCGDTFTAALDAAAFLLDELELRSRSLHRQVHALASAYHWSEADILGLSAPRRLRYLELVADDADGSSAR